MWYVIPDQIAQVGGPIYSVSSHMYPEGGSQSKQNKKSQCVIWKSQNLLVVQWKECHVWRLGMVYSDCHMSLLLFIVPAYLPQLYDDFFCLQQPTIGRQWQLSQVCLTGQPPETLIDIKAAHRKVLFEAFRIHKPSSCTKPNMHSCSKASGCVVRHLCGY